MKKLLAILLSLGVFGAYSFAQAAPTTSWSATTYIGGQIYQQGNGDVSAKLWETYDDDSNGKLLFNGALKGPSYGAKFELVGTLSSVSLGTIYGYWAPLIGDVSYFSIYGGKGFGAPYGTPIEGWDADNDNGLQLRITPIGGLTVWLTYGLGTTPVKATENYLDFGASYELPKFFKVGLGYYLGGDTKIQKLWAGIDFTMIDKLITQLDILYFNDTTTTDANLSKGGFKGEFQIGYTIAGIKPVLLLTYSSLIKDKPSLFTAKLSLSYVDLGWMVPGLYYKFALNGDNDVNNLTSNSTSGNTSAGVNTIGLWVSFPVAGNETKVYFDYKIGVLDGKTSTRNDWDVGATMKFVL